MMARFEFKFEFYLFRLCYKNVFNTRLRKEVPESKTERGDLLLLIKQTETHVTSRNISINETQDNISKINYSIYARTL